MKPFYAIIDPETGKYWDGVTPRLMPGIRGRPMTSVVRWKPNMNKTVVSWSGEKTANNKLLTYDMIRVLNNLPKLVVSKFVVEPRCVESKSFVDSAIRQTISMIYLHYGQGIADDYSYCFNTPCRHAVYVVSHTKVPRSKMLTHLPDAKIGRNYSFVTSDDLVMIKMLSGKTSTYDLSPLLTLDY